MSEFLLSFVPKTSRVSLALVSPEIANLKKKCLVGEKQGLHSTRFLYFVSPDPRMAFRKSVELWVKT